MRMICRLRRAAHGAGRALCIVLLAGALAPADGAGAQDFQDKGFYQSYVFGAPDEPSEEWLLAYGGRLYDMPAMRAFDLQTALDILAYAQTLPQRQQ